MTTSAEQCDCWCCDHGQPPPEPYVEPPPVEYTVVDDKGITFARWLIPENNQTQRAVSMREPEWAEGIVRIGNWPYRVAKWIEWRMDGVAQWRAKVGEEPVPA